MQTVNFTSKTPVVEGSLYGQNIIIIGAKRDNKSRTVSLVFNSIIDETNLIGANAFLHFEGFAPFSISENVQAVDDKITIDYLIPQPMTEAAGDKKASIQFVKVDSTIWATTDMIFRVLERTDTTGEIPADDLPDILTQVQANATAASISEDNAKLSEENAKASEGAASLSEDNAKLSETNSKTSEDNAKTSETNAGVSEDLSSQALSDLLALLGSQVATLDANGKLPIAQLPDLAIGEVIDVVSTDAMLLLANVQKGDFARVIPVDVVTECYILAADDPTILSNWKKIGMSYVAEAGHATSADTATDSTMINGHRMVTMTQAQYDIAVKDAETVYLVG